MVEVWKDIKGLENRYQVSNYGRVKSIKSDNMILKGNLRTGYPSITVIVNGKAKSYRVHRLVALAFIDNKENKRCVNHKDGNKLNNHVNNLEWVTSSENNYHAMRNGLNQAPRGHDQNFSKLTNSMVNEICARLDNGEIPANICDDYKVSNRTIYDIKLGNTWSWLTGR